MAYFLHEAKLKALGPEGPSFRFGGQGFPAFTPSGGSAGKTVAVPGPEGPGLATAGNQSRVSRLESGEIRLDIIDYVRYCAAVDLDPGEPLKELFKSWRKI